MLATWIPNQSDSRLDFSRPEPGNRSRTNKAPSILRTLPSSASCKPFACHSCTNCRGVGAFFPIWKAWLGSATGTRFFIQVLSFHILAHSFALTKNSTLLFSCASALFAQKHRGWAYRHRPFLSLSSFSYNRPAPCGTPQTHRPCGRKIKMAVPRCANEWLSVADGVAWSGELSEAGPLGFA